MLPLQPPSRPQRPSPGQVPLRYATCRTYRRIDLCYIDKCGAGKRECVGAGTPVQLAEPCGGVPVTEAVDIGRCLLIRTTTFSILSTNLLAYLLFKFQSKPNLVCPSIYSIFAQMYQHFLMHILSAGFNSRDQGQKRTCTEVGGSLTCWLTRLETQARLGVCFNGTSPGGC